MSKSNTNKTAKTTKATAANTGGNKKKSTAELASSKSKAEIRREKQKQLLIRVISGFVLLFLAFFMFLSMLSVSGSALVVLRKLACGLFGYAYWLLPMLFLYIGWLLVFKGPEPAKIRIICISLFVFWIDCFLQCLLCKIQFSGGTATVKELWTNGVSLHSAGVLGGGVADFFISLVSRVGSAFFFFVLILLFGVEAFRISVPLLIHKTAQKKAQRIQKKHPERKLPEPDPNVEGFDILTDLQIIGTFTAPTIAPRPRTPALPEPAAENNPAENSYGLVDIHEVEPTKKSRYSEENNGQLKLSDAFEASDDGGIDDIGVTDLRDYHPPRKSEPKKKKRGIEDSFIQIDHTSSYTEAVQKRVRESEPEEVDFHGEDFLEEPVTPPSVIKPNAKPAKKPANDVVIVAPPVVPVEPEPEKIHEQITEVELTKGEKSAEEFADEPVDEHVEEHETVNPVRTSQLTDEEIDEGAKAAQKSSKMTKDEAEEAADEISRQIAQQQEEPTSDYQFPPMTMLSEAMANEESNTEEMQEKVRELDRTLGSFGIDSKIDRVVRGPTVTRYEMQLQPGVRMNKITSLHEDIALTLGVTSVRVAAVPGKSSVIGIEVPNKITTSVPIREVLCSKEFQNHKSKLAFTVGKNITGSYVIGDISKMPHLLIAGTTGSGKSVCMNSIIVSLLYRAKPTEVKMIMIDPKIVELNVYNGIPHLLVPVVTDSKKAAGALQWAVTEMERRYRLMADYSVRDMNGYNKLAKSKPDEMEVLPQIVIIIDELADLMMVAAKDVENSIVRIAQKARAAGMYLVIATQRPSADVITGLMKSNIPSRIAFAVSSAINSRIILDDSGAEKLVGKGDMLYAPQGIGKPERVQGCFITDEEVEEIVAFIKKTSNEEYSAEIQNQIDANTTASSQLEPEPDKNIGDDDLDPMFPDAVEVLLDTKQASVSMLQRRLKLGYSRAARIVDEMEEKGIVGPFEGSKPRQLLITREKWETMVGLNPQAKAAENTNPAATEDDIDEMDAEDAE